MPRNFILPNARILTSLRDLIFIDFFYFIHTDVHIDHFSSGRSATLMRSQSQLIIPTLNNLQVAVRMLLPFLTIIAIVRLLETTTTSKFATSLLGRLILRILFQISNGRGKASDALTY